MPLETLEVEQSAKLEATKIGMLRRLKSSYLDWLDPALAEEPPSYEWTASIVRASGLAKQISIISKAFEGVSQTIRGVTEDMPGLDSELLSRLEAPSALPCLRHDEIEWMESHREELARYHGQWVAIEGAGIIAHGPSEVDVDRAARAKGIKIPFTIRVRSKTEGDLLCYIGWDR